MLKFSKPTQKHVIKMCSWRDTFTIPVFHSCYSKNCSLQSFKAFKINAKSFWKLSKKYPFFTIASVTTCIAAFRNATTVISKIIIRRMIVLTYKEWLTFVFDLLLYTFLLSLIFVFAKKIKTDFAAPFFRLPLVIFIAHFLFYPTVVSSRLWRRVSTSVFGAPEVSGFGASIEIEIFVLNRNQHRKPHS